MRRRRSTSTEPISQKASSRPREIKGVHLPNTKGRNNAITTLAANAQRTRCHMSGTLACFQRAIGPMPISSTMGTISGTNTVLKYGGPTESLPMPSASMNSGYSVPRNTEAAATDSSTLLDNKKDSREINSNLPPKPILGARQANSNNEEPITNTRKDKMKIPRRGSVAKACTEVSTPERTRNVPIRLSENAPMASSTVQLLKAPRFSVTASEWISA